MNSARTDHESVSPFIPGRRLGTSNGRSRALSFSTPLMKTQALQYYLHDGPTAFRFELAGDLNHEGACRLAQDWRTASSALGDRRLIIDMTFVTGVDEQGQALITHWHREGASFIANSKRSRALAAAILGEALPEPPPDALDATVSNRTWPLFRASFLVRSVTLLLLGAPVFPVDVNAATLKSETSAPGMITCQRRM